MNRSPKEMKMSYQFTGPTSTAPQQDLYADQSGALVRPRTAPAVNPPRWSGRKTAIAAALALGLGGASAATAAAVNPSHETSEQRGPMMGRGAPGQGSLSQNNQNQNAPGQGLQHPGQGQFGHDHHSR